MFFKAENYRHPAFMAAVRELAPQAPGVAAWGSGDTVGRRS